jgi:diadenosine tetraphosphatase ApaH/serine/threonine PP2A family protein phosphatase
MLSSVDSWISTLESGEALTESQITSLFSAVSAIFLEEGTVHPISLPLTICGDVHGQLYDVYELFRISGSLPETRYLFLGDYVDRGYYSLQTFCLLAALKLKYPDRIFLLRGNHECRQVNQMYGLYDECVHAFGHAGVWRQANEVFDLLPIGAIVGGSIFCVHGGLSPEIKIYEQIPLIDRFDELPNSGPFADLTWSDPGDIETWAINNRGAGWIFGHRPTREFCQNNGLAFVTRAHQIAMNGFEIHHSDQLVTVWSAPNYTYRCGNEAAVMKVDEAGNKEFVKFSAVPREKRLVPTEKPHHYFA